MTDRRSFLAKLLCLPAVGKAMAAMEYTGDVKWYYIDHRAGPSLSWFSALIGPHPFPDGYRNCAIERRMDDLYGSQPYTLEQMRNPYRASHDDQP